jgi:hypothetical protein
MREHKIACNPSSSFVQHASTQTEHYILQIDIIMRDMYLSWQSSGMLRCVKGHTGSDVSNEQIVNKA